MAAKKADPVEFELHTCYYNAVFLLRARISSNGRPLEMRKHGGLPILRDSQLHDVSVGLAHLSQKFGPVLQQYSVYHIDTFYYDEAPAFAVVFHSRDGVKNVLSKMPSLEAGLASTFVSLQSHTSLPLVEANMALYLMEPCNRECAGKPNLRQVTLGNYQSCIDVWQESKLFEFSRDLFFEATTQKG